MIIGIGIDVVHIERIRRWLDIPGLPERFFHDAELASARSRGKSAHYSLAARFAAKEALGKALGTGLRGMRLKDIEVLNNPLGRPSFQLHGSAKKRLEEAGGSNVHLSLTHEQDNAIAMVVVEA